MPLLAPFSPAELCEMFDISKSTLLRWEREGVVQPPERDTADSRGTRLYSGADVEAIAERQTEEVDQKLAQAGRNADMRRMSTGAKNIDRLKELLQKHSLRKFFQGNETGLAELREYERLHPDVLRLLLRLALNHCEPTDPTFSRILLVAYEQSCKMSGEAAQIEVR